MRQKYNSNEYDAFLDNRNVISSRAVKSGLLAEQYARETTGEKEQKLNHVAMPL